MIIIAHVEGSGTSPVTEKLLNERFGVSVIDQCRAVNAGLGISGQICLTRVSSRLFETIDELRSEKSKTGRWRYASTRLQ